MGSVSKSSGQGAITIIKPSVVSGNRQLGQVSESSHIYVLKHMFISVPREKLYTMESLYYRPHWDQLQCLERPNIRIIYIYSWDLKMCPN